MTQVQNTTSQTEQGVLSSFPPAVGRSVSLDQAAQLLGVSMRTLQDWEQGQRTPSGAARTLLLIAARDPKALLAVA